MSFMPEEEIRLRVNSLQSAMARKGFDAALVVQRADLFYLSGTGQDAHLFVPTNSEPILFVRKSLERAREDSPLKVIRPLRSFSELTGETSSISHGPLKTLGMELDVLPVQNFRIYQKLFPDTTILDISPLISEARMIKSPYEREIIYRAARMNDALFAGVAEILREGVTEIELAGLLEANARKNGHQGHVRARGFNREIYFSDIMSGGNPIGPDFSLRRGWGRGPNASVPQGAGLRTIKRHEPVQIHFVGVIGGYMVVQARTFFVGEPPRELVNVHEIALDIQQAIVEQGLPGVKAEKLYETAVEIASAAGLQKDFLLYPQPAPAIGHGVGLELDELPIVGTGSPHFLEPGMVIALESKFFLPGGGVTGIGNSFLVNEGGLQKLTLFDDAIQILD